MRSSAPEPQQRRQRQQRNGAADDCVFLSAACADADAAAAAATRAETALATARAATTSTAAETAATAAETASGAATTAAATVQQAVNAPVGPAPATGTAVNGLASSTAPKMAATDSTTLAGLFSSQPDNSYSPVSGGLKRDFGTGTTSLSGVLHVHSVQRTSADGYRIVYTDGQTQHSIEFRPEHCRPGYCEITDNGYHGFWAWDIFRWYEPFGPPRWQHVHALNLVATPEGSEESSRIAFVFGLTTPPETLQTFGEAVYTGWFRSDAYRTGDPAHNLRQRYSGQLRIVANFDISRLYGTVVDVRGSEPGSSTRNPFPTSSFSISEGKIHDNGQFTATLTGMDSDASVLDKDSIRGVAGQILGEFYGPNGGALGGVMTANRDLAGDENDLTFYGYLRGGKLNPATNLAADAHVAGVDRYAGDRTELLADDGMARVERTASGWSVTVDDQTVTFDDGDDYGVVPRSPTTYWRDLGNDRDVHGFGVTTGGFYPNQRFDHFDVKGWTYSHLLPGVDPAPNVNFSLNLVSASYVYVLHGNQSPCRRTYPLREPQRIREICTPVIFPADDGISWREQDASQYRGDATLTAAFGSSSVSGRLFNLESRAGGSGSYAGVQGELTFGAAINGNEFAASAVAGVSGHGGLSERLGPRSVLRPCGGGSGGSVRRRRYREQPRDDRLFRSRQAVGKQARR